MLESITDNKKSSTSSDISTVPRTTTYQPTPSNVEYLQLLQKLQQYEQKLAQLQETPAATSDTTNSNQQQQQQQVRRPNNQCSNDSASSTSSHNDEIFREFISQVVTTANELRAARKINE
ncbi:unnamed protein product [Caenorhabditis angaria]|uniref:Uncharacterized protein n=1 Tax=Caenorhabditis angaria TaxID=860376 RepID=A0A9P1IN47_9PELO|nr:unnamed protein product [Caenorhabditis angaria]